eukprot:scaffold138376_cov22-Tisochrysis_lutea.AAC.1
MVSRWGDEVARIGLGTCCRHSRAAHTTGGASSPWCSGCLTRGVGPRGLSTLGAASALRGRQHLERAHGGANVLVRTERHRDSATTSTQPEEGLMPAGGGTWRETSSAGGRRARLRAVCRAAPATELEGREVEEGSPPSFGRASVHKRRGRLAWRGGGSAGVALWEGWRWMGHPRLGRRRMASRGEPGEARAHPEDREVPRRRRPA